MSFKLSIIFPILIKLALYAVYRFLGLNESGYLFSTIIIILWFSIVQLKIRYNLNRSQFLIQLPTIIFLNFIVLQVSIPMIYMNLFFENNGRDYYEWFLKEENYLPYLNVALDYTFIGMCMFWWGVNAFDKKNILIKFDKFFQFSNKPISIYLLLFLYSLGILSRFLMMYLGLYGYAVEFEIGVDYQEYRIFLSMIEQLCSLTFFLVVLQRSESNRILFITIILIELFFALLSGFKFNVIQIALILFIAKYLQTNSFSIKYTVFTLFLTLFAFTIIEPLRLLRRAGVVDSSIGSYFSTMGEAVVSSTDTKELNDTEKLLITNTLMERFDVVTMSAALIRHKDKYGLTKDDPDFFKHLTFVPFYALIPRILWKDKPIFNYGQWNTRTVIWEGNPAMENNATSSTLGPIGYLYLCGGLFYIILHFFILGYLAAYFTKLLLFSKNVVNLLLYLVVIGAMLNMDVSNLYNFIIKSLPIILFTFYLIFGKIKEENNIAAL
jgi:hypothetical protein